MSTLTAATAERVEMEADSGRKPRIRNNSGESHSDSVVSYVSSKVSSANGGNSEVPASASPTPSKKGRRGRGGAKKVEELGPIVKEASAIPTSPMVLTRSRRNSKSDDETESIVLEESSQNVTESALVCAPLSSPPTSAIGSVQSPVVVKQEESKGQGGGRKPQRPRPKKDNKREVKGGVTYDDLDFHSPWYASMFDASAAPQLFGPYLDVAAKAEELPKMPPNYLSRELMIQLTCNINNGLTYVGQAFESARLGAQELYNAKLTLERIYRNQHRSVDNEILEDNQDGHRNASNTVDVSGGLGGSSDRTESFLERSSSNTTEVLQRDATAESLQLNVDPYQYLSGGDTPGGNLTGSKCSNIRQGSKTKT